MKAKRFVTVLWAVALLGSSAFAAQKPRLGIGEFTARRIAPPTIDGKIEPGEWDKAFTTSGMIAPFEHELQTADTTTALGYDEKNFYCYSCGNKLRRKPSKDSKAKKDIPLEPGSIAVVGDQRVARVVICPKCNAANKQSDKFCFNCGKKLRAERVKAKDKARQEAKNK